MLAVGRLPPAAPVPHILRRLLKVVADIAHGLFLPSQRASQPPHVRAHGIAFVADEIALRQVHRPAGTRKGQGSQEKRQLHLLWDIADVDDALAHVPHVNWLYYQKENDQQKDQHRGDQHRLDALYRAVHHRPQTQRQPDHQQARNRIANPRTLVTAKLPSQDSRRPGRPTRPHPRDHVAHQKNPGPARPLAAKSSHRGLAGSQGPALDFHVDEILGQHPHHAGPEHREAELVRYVGPEHELPTAQRKPQQQDARPNQLAPVGRLGQVAVLPRRQPITRYYLMRHGLSCHIVPP